MKKNTIVIQRGRLIKLIYEAIVSQKKSDHIDFVMGDVGDVDFIEYFGIDPRDVKGAFFRNGGDKVSSFLGMKPSRVKFNLLNGLTSTNLSVKEYHRCDFGTLEIWMFFSDSRSHGGDDFYVMVTLKSDGGYHKGERVDDVTAGRYVKTSRLSSEAIGIMVVDLLVNIYHQMSGRDIKSIDSEYVLI